MNSSRYAQFNLAARLVPPSRKCRLALVPFVALATIALAQTSESPQDRFAAVAALSAADAASHWQAGEVRFADRWTTPDQVAQLMVVDLDQIAYRERRSKLPDTADAHIKLAQWCRERRLANEYRAHLLVATQLAPNDPLPHRALGLVAYRGTWLSESEIVAARTREAETAKAIQSWRNRFIALRQLLASTDPTVGEAAESQLLEVRDPLAILAMEEIIAPESERLGRLSVEVVGRILHKAATRSLVRHAVWHTSPQVREAALDQLLHRDPNHYVGELIHLMRPSATGESWTRLANGTPAHVWFAQDYDRNYVTVSVIDPTVTFGPLTHKAAERPENRRIRTQAATARVEARNQFRMENAHAALSRATGEDFGTEQAAWVKWWQDVSYVGPGEYTSPSRTTVVRYEKIGLFDPTKASCFVAGTMIWTQRGMVPIDHVQLGELVLSKNIETGELGYQPVIDRTIRRQKPTLNLQFDGEMIGVTPGHAIWSAHKGWMRARDFRAGDSLGTCGGSVELLASSEGAADFVYNLVVAGSNTYFVGPNRILVHDITPVADTVISPSLSSESEN